MISTSQWMPPPATTCSISPRCCAYCEENRVYWLEEPFTPDNIPAYAELRTRTAIPIAAGENHYGRPAFRALFEARAISICQADFCKSGGLSELKKISDMAAAWHIPDGAAHQPQHPERRRQCASAVRDPERADLRGGRGCGEPGSAPTSPRATRAWSTAISSRPTGRASASRSTRRCWSAIRQFRGPATFPAGPGSRAERPRRGEGAMTPEITPADATLGAVVSNVRLNALDDEAFALIEEAWHARAVLIFPGQHLSEEEQVDFSRRFGPAGAEPYQDPHARRPRHHPPLQRQEGRHALGSRQRHGQAAERQQLLAHRQLL